MKEKHTYRGVVLRSAPRTPAGLNAPPPPGRVRVARVVAGRGGKAVSVISGLPLGAAALEELAARLKKICGAGGTVRDGTIEIQGEHRARLVAELIKLGYAAKQSGG
ncbi:MAG: translation initiation factor [Gammaproteobacteria bacterium]|nr:translation initiation factor [Gammaproteobacteria bacterium]MBV9697294.1 translation initiation factor [Gammaproteobacteria bacterium]